MKGLKRLGAFLLAVALILATFSLCGFTCNHRRYKDYYNGNSEYCDYNSSGHYVRHFYDRVCKSCNKVIDEVESMEWKKHKLNSRGKCACGYSKKTCEHDDYTDYYNGRTKYIRYNDEEHYVRNYYDRICDDCNVVIKEVNKKEWKEHDLNARGECDCGYENVICEHYNYTDYYNGRTKYIKYDDNEHYVRNYYDRICDDCGELVKEVNKKEWKEHDLNSIGVCDCGYEIEICEHSYRRDYYNGKTEYYTSNEEKHCIRSYYDRTCRECGEVIEEVFDEQWLGHIFDSKGKCECGYSKEVECLHENCEDMYSRSKYLNHSEIEHYVKHYYNVECKDCGEVLGETYKHEWGNHNFNTNGKCACGYSKKTTTPSTETKPETPIQPEATTPTVEIVNYSIELDKSQDYVTIKVEGNSNTTAITVCLTSPDKAIDSINVQSKTAEAKFRVPFTVEVVKYEVLIVAYGKDYSDLDRVDETFTANNPKTLWNWVTEGISNFGAMTFGVVGGAVNGAFIDPVFLAAEIVDYGLNIFDQGQYEKNKEWRNELKQSVENFIVDKMSADQAYYYYCGKFGGETADLIVGGVYAINGIKGIIKSVTTHSGGVKVVNIALDNGDEALAMMSGNSDDVLMLAKKLDTVVYKTLDEGVNFTDSALKQFIKPERHVSTQMLIDTIKTGIPAPDPQGVKNLTMYYKQVAIRGKMYNLEVLYDSVTNTIKHFMYDTDALGPLAQITK